MPNEPASPVVKLDYFQLFVNKGGPSPEPEDLESFVAVAERLTLPPYQRLLAAEFLRARGRPAPMDDRALALLHAQAMPGATEHNPWGLPGTAPGPLGVSLLSLGALAEEALRPLLVDQTPLNYFGSEEPTLASMYHYRVADLAAWLLARQQGREFIDARSVAARDAWVQANLLTRPTPP